MFNDAGFSAFYSNKQNVLVLLKTMVPKEVLWYIFGYAGPSSFSIFRLVCKRWKQIVDSDNFKRFFNNMGSAPFRDYPLSLFNLFDCRNPRSYDEYLCDVEGGIPFSENSFSLFDVSPIGQLPTEMVATFVSRDNFNNGLVIPLKKVINQYGCEVHKHDTVADEQSFLRCTDKLVSDHSAFGNQNNWGTSKTPNSIAINKKSSSLDELFSQLPLGSHPIPGKSGRVTETEYNIMRTQRDQFDKQLQQSQTYGMGGLVYGGG